MSTDVYNLTYSSANISCAVRGQEIAKLINTYVVSKNAATNQNFSYQSATIDNNAIDEPISFASLPAPPGEGSEIIQCEHQ